jgi:hypothetical protein
MRMTDSLLAYVRSNDRICPVPDRWNELWELLERSRRSGSESPPPPLILAAWHSTSGLEKILRLDEQIRFAADQKLTDHVDAFLRGLREDEWVHWSLDHS